MEACSPGPFYTEHSGCRLAPSIPETARSSGPRATRPRSGRQGRSQHQARPLQHQARGWCDRTSPSARDLGSSTWRDLSVRMRNDRREPNGAKTQRPERIPIDPEHRSYSRNATAAVAIDSLLQNSGRREHDYATRRIRHLGAGLRIAADTLTFLDFSCHSSVSLQFPARSNKTDTSMGI